MDRRTILRRTGTGALVGLVAGALAFAGLATPAQAGTNGGWTTLASGSGFSNITEPDVVRLPSSQANRLLVGWSTQSFQNAGVYTREVSTSGKPVGGVHRVVSGWASLDQRVAFARTGSKVAVAFQGIRTTNVGEKYDGSVAYATSTNGASWALSATELSASASGGYALDLVDVKGTLVSAFTAASDDRLRYHVGAAAADGATTAHTGNAYSGTLARDRKTGEVWAAWYQGSTSSSAAGIWTQRILPTASRAVRAPGSATMLQPSQSVALVPRSSGGVYVAYTVGYPTTKYVRLWKVGSKTSSSTYTQVKATNARDVSASTASGGRLWLAWTTGYSGHKATAKAARTSTSAKRIGAVVTTKAVHSSTIWKTAIEGSRTAADIVVTAAVKDSSNAVALYQTQVKAGLTVSVSPSSVRKAKGGYVRVTVTDAGAKVKGAKVTYKGKRYTTNSHGQAKIKVAKGTSTGTKKMSVSKSGYTSKTVTFKVRK